MKTEIKRTALNVSTWCNLKCKNCLAFIPYYKNPSHLDLDTAKKTLDVYFKVVDKVTHFTVTGGEPLLNKDIVSIMQEVYQYKNQVGDSIDFVTNGTILITDELLNLFEENKEKTKVVVSNYGEKLSTKIGEIEEELKRRGIEYRLSKFFGDDLYYDGWIDFSDHSLKWKTDEEREKNAAGCLHATGRYYVILGGELHRCSRCSWRTQNKIIPKIVGEYVPLMDEKYSIEEKREILLDMYSRNSTTSCAHCVGFRNDAQRVFPAQQLSERKNSS